MSQMSESSTPEGGVGRDTVEVSVPVRTEYLSTLRTVAAALGADAGFSIDEIDDLRLAISEVVSSFVEIGQRVTPHPDDRIDVVFGTDGDTLAVEITTRRGDFPIELDDLATGILASVVDRCDISPHSVRVVKVADEAVRAEDGTGVRSVTDT